MTYKDRFNALIADIEHLEKNATYNKAWYAAKIKNAQADNLPKETIYCQEQYVVNVHLEELAKILLRNHRASVDEKNAL